MKKILPQIISSFIILFFVLSCSGTGFLMSLENNQHINEHSCCSLNNSLGVSQGSMHNNLLFLHSTEQSALLLTTLIALTISVFFFYKNILALSNLLYFYFKKYLDYWQRQARYFSLLLQRLFSLGLLHTKTW